MANALGIVNAFVAVLPAGALFFLAYGRYDGSFRDQTVFLHFMGGLLLGGLLGFATLATYATGAILVHVLLPPLLYPVAILSIQNRRKWQGDRHAVFNAGAMGLGVAAMVSFSFLYVVVTDLTPARVGQGVLLATSMAFLLFGLGLLVGDAVRRKSPFRSVFVGAAILLAPAVFLEEYFREQAWLWLVLLVASGAVFAYAANQKLLPEGLEEDGRRERRRRRKGERSLPP